MKHYFDRIYCINLPHRTDRWKASLLEFEKLGIVVATLDKPLLITGGQIESKKPSDGYQFINQLKLKIGSTFTAIN